MTHGIWAMSLSSIALTHSRGIQRRTDAVRRFRPRTRIGGVICCARANGEHRNCDRLKRKAHRLNLKFSRVFWPEKPALFRARGAAQCARNSRTRSPSTSSASSSISRDPQIPQRSRFVAVLLRRHRLSDGVNRDNGQVWTRHSTELRSLVVSWQS